MLEGNALWREIKVYSRSSSQIPHDCTVFFLIGTADNNWLSVVVLNLGLPVYTEFPCLKISPLHNFQKRDCPCILAHTSDIGLLLLMGDIVLNMAIYGPRVVVFIE
jgi:hypothetical protein